MTTISAKTILRSRNLARPDKVVSTLLLRYPRCIHAEFMTHRAMSRNAASSRAIPVSKLIQDVLDDPFVPLHWGKNERGMQAGQETAEPLILSGASEFDMIERQFEPISREKAWLWHRDQAVATARAFSGAGYHKQIVNRLLEPFAHITVVVTATEWNNFIALRDHKDAEPHIQILAREVRRCLENDPIQDLEPGEWHLPFVSDDDQDALIQAFGIDLANDTFREAAKIKLSVARCASTSYKTVDGFDMTPERAIELHDKLLASSPLHASPAEHQCQADEIIWTPAPAPLRSMVSDWEHPEQHGNLVGFRQYRKMLPNEAVPG